MTQLVCEHDNSPVSGPLYFLAYWYYLSKYYELLDTIILCLRKRPLTLLHVYHHSIVVLLTYLWVSSDYALYWWTVWLNTMVHVFMYFYFFLISLGKKISNSWKVTQIFLSFGKSPKSTYNFKIIEIFDLCSNWTILYLWNCCHFEHLLHYC